MDFLKRNLAPLVDEAWKEIEEQAIRVLKENLSARKLVDFAGPKGFDFSAVNLGHLAPKDETTSEGVRYGIRQVLALCEVRVPFELDIWNLDDLARGAAAIEADAVVHAAAKLAQFEERAIYKGFEAGRIIGLGQATSQTPVVLGSEPSAYPDAVTRAMLALNDAGVGGPYALVLGPRPFRLLSADVSTYPLRQRIAKLIDGPVLHSPVLEGGFLMSLRGGDFELTVGQDASIGYDHHDSKKVSLYLTETFTFRVIGPEAVVELSG